MKSLLIFGSLLILSFSRVDYKTWIDADNDCQNTRDEILIAESIESPVLDRKGCKVLTGKWHDKYTGAYFTKASDLDIDHLVPLAEVDRSGGSKWPKEMKIAYANDLFHKETLIAVSASQNRAKSDKDPSDWMPKNQDYHCEYLKNWLLVKKTWKLEADEKERKFIEKELKNACGLKN